MYDKAYDIADEYAMYMDNDQLAPYLRDGIITDEMLIPFFKDNFDFDLLNELFGDIDQYFKCGDYERTGDSNQDILTKYINDSLYNIKNLGAFDNILDCRNSLTSNHTS